MKKLYISYPNFMNSSISYLNSLKQVLKGQEEEIEENVILYHTDLEFDLLLIFEIENETLLIQKLIQKLNYKEFNVLYSKQDSFINTWILFSKFNSFKLNLLNLDSNIKDFNNIQFKMIQISNYNPLELIYQ